MKFTKKQMLEWFAGQLTKFKKITTRHKVVKIVKRKRTDISYIVQRGYFQLGIVIKNRDTGKMKEDEGGWKPSDSGRMFVAICECGAVAQGWSDNEVTKDLLKFSVSNLTGEHRHLKATGRMKAVKVDA